MQEPSGLESDRIPGSQWGAPEQGLPGGQFASRQEVARTWYLSIAPTSVIMREHPDTRGLGGHPVC